MINNKDVVEGITSILSNFDDRELFALASTVTQGLLKNKLETREEALDAILKYSSDAESFLKRKAVTRDNLFQYLHENDVDVKLPITKEKLIEKIIKFWSNEDCIIPTNEITYIKPNAIAPAPTTNEIALPPPTELDVMALKFSEWFYSMMNQNDLIDVEHFYRDSHLKIKLINEEQMVVEEVDKNVDDLVHLLFKTKHQHNLYFNPNLSKEGTRGKMDPHGLVIIMCCGTLHINSTVSGVFEQYFSVARDPFSDNNWKIKNTELTLRSRNDVTQPPQLCDIGGSQLQITEV